MKKIILFLSLIIFTVSVNANSISLNCNKTTVTPNETFTCNLKGNTATEVSSITAKIALEGDISLINVDVPTIWQGNGDGGLIDLYTDENKTGTFNIATISLKAGSLGTYKILVNNIEFTDANFESSNVAGLSTTIVIEEKKVETNTNNNAGTTSNKNASPNTGATNKSSNNLLKILEITESPIAFDKKNTEYTLSVPYEIEKLNIIAEAADAKSTIVIAGNENLIVGDNVITITVTAENGKTREYKLNVERTEEKIGLSKDSSLIKLTIDGYNIDFKKDVYEYDLKIKKTDSLKISTKANDDNAKVTIIGNKDLKTGSVIKITVTAEDGTTSTYVVNIEEYPSYTWMIISIIEAIILVITYAILIIKKIIFIRKKQ